MDSTINYFGTAPKRRAGSWVYKLFLYLSFVWVSVYPVASTIGTSFFTYYGNLISGANSEISTLIVFSMLEALLGWLGFEIIFWLYRMFLTFKIYSFVVPVDELKNTSRLFFGVKNILYGALLLLCFWFPYLYSFMELFNLILIVSLLILFAVYIQKKYSEPIIAHFVFKNFCYPVFVYECILLAVSVLEVLL